MTRFDTQALLFDMDGTLVDSTAAVMTAWRALCERYGIDADEVLAVTHGVPAAQTIAKFWPEAHRAEAHAWIEEAESTMLDDVVEIPGAISLTERLQGARWGIVTSATPRLAKARLEAAGIAIPDVLVTAADVQFGKPNPEPFVLGAARLGVDPAAVIVLEDAPAGIQAGRAAGASVVVRGRHGGPDAEGLLAIDNYLSTVIDEVSPLVRGRWA